MQKQRWAALALAAVVWSAFGLVGDAAAATNGPGSAQRARSTTEIGRAHV